MSKSNINSEVVSLIIKLNDEGEDKNAIMRELFNSYGDTLEFSDFEKLYKESEVGKKKCYRTKTSEMFRDNPDVSLEEWCDTMILEGFLSTPEKFQSSDDATRVKEGIKNYRQIFPMLVAIKHGISMADLK